MRAKKRMSEIASLIDGANCVADIGSDHGFLGKMLIEQNRAKKVIATDISPMCLKKTENLAKRFGLDSKIETRVGDGLEPIFENEVDVAVMAGIGGQEIIRILKTQNLKNIKNFVIVPAQNAPELRLFLSGNGFEIVQDKIVKDQNIFYNIMFVQKNDKIQKLQKCQILFGIYCKDCKNPDFVDFLVEFIEKRNYLISQNIMTEKIQEELKLALKILNKIKQEN